MTNPIEQVVIPLLIRSIGSWCKHVYNDCDCDIGRNPFVDQVYRFAQ